MAVSENTPADITAAAANASDEARKGILAALAAYLLWGFLPLLIRQVESVGALMVVAERTVWSLVLMAIIAAVGRLYPEVWEILRDPRRLRIIALSAALLAVNWLLYVVAIETGQVLQASFGYFINPLVNVAIGMAFLGERQNRLQALAIGIAAIAILIQAIGMGSVPYLALGLAITFGFYGLIRKTAKAGPATGLFMETMVVAPFALAYIGFTIATAGVGVHADPTMLFWLMMTGPATAIPLLLFAYGVRRMRMTTIGMLQYIAPSIQFGLAIVVFGEELNALRLVSFALIWLSLVIFSYDSFRQRRRARTADHAGDLVEG